MVGRGELGFVMAEEAYNQHGLTSRLVFAITSWALLISSLISPVVFKCVLRSTPKNLTHREGSKAENQPESVRIEQPDPATDHKADSPRSGQEPAAGQFQENGRVAVNIDNKPKRQQL